MEDSSETYSEDFVFDLPVELIEYYILPYSALEWLLVTKRYHYLAIQVTIDNPIYLKQPNSALVQAILDRNHKLLKILLSDSRYRPNSHSVSELVNSAREDQTSCLFLVNYGIGTSIIFDRAIRLHWIDVVKAAMKKLPPNNVFSFRSDYLKDVHYDIFKLLIEDNRCPKLDATRLEYISRNIDNRVIQTALESHNIDFESAITVFGKTEKYLEKILLDERLKTSKTNQKHMWETLLGAYNRNYALLGKIKHIIENNLLDPSIDNNYPLQLDINTFNNEDHIIEYLLNCKSVQITLEPISENVLNLALKRSGNGREKALGILTKHPKINMEWVRDIFEYNLMKDTTIQSIWAASFIIERFPQYVSEELKAQAPKIIKQKQRLYPVYFNYDDDPAFWEDSEDEECDSDDEVEESENTEIVHDVGDG